MANGQADYNLRDGFPLVGAGSPNIDPQLTNDLARGSTTVPQTLDNDVTSSETLTPVTPRDTGGPPTIGYHYPVLDFVMNGATVNNATLNIDQGVVIGFAGYWAYECAPFTSAN